jgi:hypothetical protein
MKLFLDVDGVVAPLPFKAHYWGDYENIGRGSGPTPIVGFRELWLSHCLANAINNLGWSDGGKQYDLERVWLTTWGQLANEKIGPYFGWYNFPVLEDEHGTNPKGYFINKADYYQAMKSWWKLEQIRKQTTPFIWVDDDIELYAIQHPHALDFLGEHEIPPLIICPESSEGLTPNHIDLMRQYVEKYAKL